MLERGINNMEQYQITDERLVRDAAEQLKVALKQDMIELKDLMDLRIGGLVNNIRKNNRQNNNLKSLLRGLVQDMQARARDAPKNGVAAAVANPANGTTAPKPVRRTPPVKNGDVVNGGEKRVTPVENVQHPRLHDLKEEKKPKSRKSPKSRTKSPQVAANTTARSTPTPPPGGLHSSPPKIGAAPPPDAANKIPPVKFRISPTPAHHNHHHHNSNQHPAAATTLHSQSTTDQSEPVETSEPLPSLSTKKNGVSRSTSPIVDGGEAAAARPAASKKRKLPDCEHSTNNSAENRRKQQQSPVNSKSTKETKETEKTEATINRRATPTSPPPPNNQHHKNRANPSPHPPIAEQNQQRTAFTDQSRFAGAVKCIHRDVPAPSTPNPDQIDAAADGAELDGVTGVRDTQGTFHRWHEEITLDPDGSEPFMHILPYVDIDLELL